MRLIAVTGRTLVVEQPVATPRRRTSDGIEESDDAPAEYELVQQDSLASLPADEAVLAVTRSMS